MQFLPIEIWDSKYFSIFRSSENVQCSKCKMIYETNHLWMLHFFPYEYCHRKSMNESGNHTITTPPPGFHDYFRIPDVKPQLNVEPKVPQLPITRPFHTSSDLLGDLTTNSWGQISWWKFFLAKYIGSYSSTRPA